ncbi:MAG: glycosyltransferase [Bacteroidales bacterium]|jgi:glycosyltransferase involved in cell wall biosynthesis|nr:glycosyltransferase [Bacteroidales bacterium]
MDIIFSFFSQLSVVEWVLGAVLLFFFFIQLLFHLLLYRKPYIYERKRKETAISGEELPGISVILTSKNNSDELEMNLPFMLNQDYPNFEVIVVNSGSTDETDMMLKAAGLKYPQLYHTHVPAEADSINEKKLALTLGIKAAKNDILLFTEAYCRPCTTAWIRSYGREFAKGRDIVLGYSRLVMDKKVRMRRFILFDNLIHHLKFISMAIAGKPFMGIGRNMAYRKELFFGHKGFSPILNREGGEDDLYINRIARGKSTGVVVSPESMTETHGIDSFFTWRSLKSKYLYSKQFYKGSASHLFGLETFSKFSFFTALIAAVTVGAFTSSYYLAGFALLLLIIRFWVQLVIINRNSRLFDGGKYHINLLLFDLFQPFNNFRFRKYANRRNNSRR